MGRVMHMWHGNCIFSRDTVSKKTDWRREISMDRRQSATTGGDEMRQLISFTVGAEEFGLELLRVKEVIRMRQIIWLPNAPAFVKGIINLRGDVIPIIDLHGKFGLEAGAETASTRVIVVEVKGQPVGMVVDAASEVVRVAADQVAPPPPLVRMGEKEFVTGVAKLEERLIILVDVDSIFSTDEVGDIAKGLHAGAGEPVESIGR